MAYALVGTIGAVTVGGAGAAITPAWGTSENRTAGNLLVCWVAGQTSVAGGPYITPPTPAGWSRAALADTGGTQPMAAIFYRIAAGADAAPTFAAGTMTWIAQVAEFSGGATNGEARDQAAVSGNLGNSTASWTVTCPRADTAAGELVVTAISAYFSQAATRNLTDSVNNGVALTSSNNNAAAISTRYAFAYGVTTSNAAATADSASISNLAGCQGETSLLATFFLAGGPPRLLPIAQATAKAFAIVTTTSALVFVGHAEAAAATVNLPSGWQVGDLAFVYAYRNGSTAAPTTPAGWTAVNAATGANTNSRAQGYRVLQAGDTSTGTWTNATAVTVVILRGQAASPMGGLAIPNGSNNQTMTQDAVTPSKTDGTSWILLFAGSKAANTNTVAFTGSQDLGSTVGALNIAVIPNVTAAFAGGAYAAIVDTAGNRTDATEILSGPKVTAPTGLPSPLLSHRSPVRVPVAHPARGRF